MLTIMFHLPKLKEKVRAGAIGYARLEHAAKNAPLDSPDLGVLRDPVEENTRP